MSLVDDYESKYALNDKAREQIGRLLDLVSKEKRPCKSCGRMIWLVPMKSGRDNPITDDAVSHFIDCPHREQHRRTR